MSRLPSNCVTDASELDLWEFRLLSRLIDDAVERKPWLLDGEQEPLDPARFVQIFGGDTYQFYVDSAEDWFDWLWKEAAKVCDINTPSGIADIIRGFLPRIVQHPDRITQLGYIHKLSARTGIPVKAILVEAGTYRKR